MQAADDFEAAILLLPVEYEDPNDLGRATEGAARGMLAKVYMQLKDWDSARGVGVDWFSSVQGTRSEG